MCADVRLWVRPIWERSLQTQTLQSNVIIYQLAEQFFVIFVNCRIIVKCEINKTCFCKPSTTEVFPPLCVHVEEAQWNKRLYRGFACIYCQVSCHDHAPPANATSLVITSKIRVLRFGAEQGACGAKHTLVIETSRWWADGSTGTRPEWVDDGRDVHGRLQKFSRRGKTSTPEKIDNFASHRGKNRPHFWRAEKFCVVVMF